jgi:hypothetical protein
MAMAAAMLLGLVAGARAELIDPAPLPESAIQASADLARPVPVPHARPHPAVARRIASARPAPAAFPQPQQTGCLGCARYVLIVGIGF